MRDIGQKSRFVQPPLAFDVGLSLNISIPFGTEKLGWDHGVATQQ